MCHEILLENNFWKLFGVSEEWECERAEREKQRRVEIAKKDEKKWKGEKDEEAEREARLEFERYSRAIERAAEAVFRTSQLDLQEQQITLLEAKAQSEKDRDNTKVIQLKKYGEVLRNSVTKLGIEPMEIIVFLKILSGNFGTQNLHVSSMKAYLNDRARTSLDHSYRSVNVKGMWLLL